MTPLTLALYHVGVGLLFASAGACLLFMLLYQTLAPWWRSEAGRHVMAFMAVLFVALALTASNAMGWTRSMGVFWLLVVEIIVFTLILAVVCWRIAILLRAQRRRRP